MRNKSRIVGFQKNIFGSAEPILLPETRNGEARSSVLTVRVPSAVYHEVQTRARANRLRVSSFLLAVITRSLSKNKKSRR